ncbi:hypothetical protein VFDL14_15705 [Vibrio fortis]|uniref:Alkaline phosphatase family protein n=1 Tax=Vibrio fortis TaxID=212667 RepID=A0A066UWV0_9VIBR|nr:alkaline phosphatase family protein [Vibrio fortis]KDN28693.1 hypothetical protein VFDL14_15705 [Vibrio fortis]
MKKSIKTVLVVIDAFRYDYLDRGKTPFLSSLIKDSRYIRKLTPSYGFCERTEIVVGLTALESNYFTALGFNPELSPYKSIEKILSFVDLFYDKLPKIGQRIFRRLLWEFSSRKEFGFSSVNVPLSYLKFFSLTEDGHKSHISESEDSLYRFLPKLGYKINDESFTSLDKKQVFDDSGRIKNLINNIDDECSLYMLYLGDCDKYGHSLGPNTKEMDDKLLGIDRDIEKLVQDISQKNEDVNYIFVGDHGMSEVVNRIDLLSMVESKLSKYTNGIDYLLFADSTVFRIWILSDRNKCDIENIINQLFLCEILTQNGMFTTPSQLGLKDDRTYGDYIWCANNGVVISPDYFNPSYKIINGMHGYNPIGNDQAQGMAIFYGPDFSASKDDSACLTSIYKTIRELYSE